MIGLGFWAGETSSVKSWDQEFLNTTTGTAYNITTPGPTSVKITTSDRSSNKSMFLSFTPQSVTGSPYFTITGLKIKRISTGALLSASDTGGTWSCDFSVFGSWGSWIPLSDIEYIEFIVTVVTGTVGYMRLIWNQQYI